MKLKFLVSIFILQFILSCCKNFEFSDFNEMEAKVSAITIASNDSLSIDLYGKDVIWIGSVLPTISLTSAYAIKCDYGWGGMKYPFDTIEITSNANFDSNHFSGTLLNNLFKMKYFDRNTFANTPKIDSISTENLKFGDVFLILHEKPSIDKKHKFKIRLVKSNNEVIEVTTEEIEWL
jgi:hypothetical protein